MKYFISPNEDRQLDATTRESLRGSFIRLSDGITHYELTGPADGAIVVLTGGLTVPLFYWDVTAAALHDYGLQTLTYSAYGRVTPTASARTMTRHCSCVSYPN